MVNWQKYESSSMLLGHRYKIIYISNNTLRRLIIVLKNDSGFPRDSFYVWHSIANVQRKMRAIDRSVLLKELETSQ